MRDFLFLNAVFLLLLPDSIRIVWAVVKSRFLWYRSLFFRVRSSTKHLSCKIYAQNNFCRIANHGKWRICEIKISSNYHANETIELKSTSRMVNEISMFAKKGGGGKAERERVSTIKEQQNGREWGRKRHKVKKKFKWAHRICCLHIDRATFLSAALPST